MDRVKYENYVVSHATYEGKGRRLWIDNEYSGEICQIFPDVDGKFVNPYNRDTAMGKIVDYLINLGEALPVGNYTFSYF